MPPSVCWQTGQGCWTLHCLSRIRINDIYLCCAHTIRTTAYSTVISQVSPVYAALKNKLFWQLSVDRGSRTQVSTKTAAKSAINKITFVICHINDKQTQTSEWVVGSLSAIKWQAETMVEVKAVNRHHNFALSIYYDKKSAVQLHVLWPCKNSEAHVQLQIKHIRT